MNRYQAVFDRKRGYNPKMMYELNDYLKTLEEAFLPLPEAGDCKSEPVESDFSFS